MKGTIINTELEEHQKCTRAGMENVVSRATGIIHTFYFGLLYERINIKHVIYFNQHCSRIFL